MHWKRGNQKYHDECKEKIKWFDEKVMICMHNQIPATKELTFPNMGCLNYMLDKYDVENVKPPEMCNPTSQVVMVILAQDSSSMLKLPPMVQKTHNIHW